jgi:hypothetical protein
MDLSQIIYSSRPFGFDEALLGGILSDARRNNTRDGITGALICRADVYLQMLEGPADVVEAAFARIARDDRHLEVEMRFSTHVTERLFPQWSMRDDPAKSWMWTQEEVANGVLSSASPMQVLAVFTRLANELA